MQLNNYIYDNKFYNNFILHYVLIKKIINQVTSKVNFFFQCIIFVTSYNVHEGLKHIVS